MKRKLIAGFVAIVGMLGLILAWAVVATPSGSVATREDGVSTLEIAMLQVPVADAEPLIEGPDQFLGVPHATPRFDTTDLGSDLSFQQDTSALDPLDSDEVLRAVYLGHDSSGQPYYIWHNGSPDFRQRIGQMIADFGAFGRLESSYGTEATGDGLFSSSLEQQIEDIGLVSGSISSGSDQPTTLTAEWHGLPDEVSAVVFYERDAPFGWQTPVSGTAAVQIEYGNTPITDVGHEFELVALTATGEEWNRHLLFP